MTDLLDRYLRELDAADEPRDAPSPEQLTRLHRAHLQRFSHDTLWVARDRVPELGYESMVHALLGGEGGACAQLTVSFAWLLRQLGYEVGIHRAVVQLGFDEDYRDWPGHVNLTVELDGQQWYVDVGMGNGILEPVPLVEGAFDQAGGFSYRLEPSSRTPGRWSFVHDSRLRAIRRTEFDPTPGAGLDAFAWAYDRVTTDVTSPFREEVVVNRRHAGGVSTLSGTMLVERGEHGRSRRTIGSAEEWEQVLREDFRLGLPDWSEDERDRLWRRVSGAR